MHVHIERAHACCKEVAVAHSARVARLKDEFEEVPHVPQARATVTAIHVGGLVAPGRADLNGEEGVRTRAHRVFEEPGSVA